jgi:predicted GIY-YIG superfamily endonuclease
MKNHKKGNGGMFTKVAGVNNLLFKEEFSSRIEATKRKSQIKGRTKRKKLVFFRGFFATRARRHKIKEAKC